MAHVSEPRFRVAHGLRLKGFALASVVAEIAALEEHSVHGHLAELAELGHARHREGRITGWSLTGEGRSAHHAACARELDASGAEATVRGAYDRFLKVNGPLLAACTDWQLRADASGGTPVLNTHDDPDYDRAVIERLVQIDAEVQPLIAELASVLHRFGAYADRLSSALRRVQAGEADWFTGAMCESYHTVWFELHEDLLVTLGIERSSEQAPAARGGA